MRTWHSFAFGTHYDPDDVGFGLLLAHNDEQVAAGGGYEPHRHRGIEVVTWVVDGVLVHRHGDGPERLVGAGSVQVLHAGSGVEHSELATAQGPVRLVQAWLPSARPDEPPSYEARDLAGELTELGAVVAAGGLACDAGGPGVALVRPDAALHMLRPTGLHLLPPAPALHVYVTRGEVFLDGVGRLTEGDAVRATGVHGDWLVRAHAPAEVLVWEMRPGTR